ncbi:MULTISPECIES: hypothetical protein [unclassified Chamaesiphon]|uniref:Tse2 family ADP-ribosyltransferase toxin n=1 Tax=unclassified Chamaesiphon TaxID=2620921 RepID=UPI00286D196C|nr:MULTISPECIES: hypothetical protein [unclassified Chamaesiphon]
MRRTPVDLYRMGNAVSARLEHIRAKDIDLYEDGDKIWVAANSGGISTFSVRGNGRNWWKLDREAEIPSELRVVNDYGDHWLWEPSYSMPLDEYRQALQSLGEQFYKIS